MTCLVVPQFVLDSTNKEQEHYNKHVLNNIIIMYKTGSIYILI